MSLFLTFFLFKIIPWFLANNLTKDGRKIIITKNK